MAKRWTTEEDELMLRLRSEGFSAREITTRLPGRTYAGVRTRLASLAPDNLKRPWTQEDKDLLAQLKSEGKSNKVISKIMDRTPRAIASYVSRYWHNGE